MIVRIEVTEDLLKVIPIIYLQKEVDWDYNTIFVRTDHIFSAGGMHLLEDMAMALNIYDRRLKGTEDDPEGLEHVRAEHGQNQRCDAERQQYGEQDDADGIQQFEIFHISFTPAIIMPSLRCVASP